MDDGFLDEYFINLNEELKDKKFTSYLRKEFDEIDEDRLKELIESHF